MLLERGPLKNIDIPVVAQHYFLFIYLFSLYLEFAKKGSLQGILEDSGQKLPFRRRIELLHSAALGINYLHSLHPVIVHRDIKPSNLLVCVLYRTFVTGPFHISFHALCVCLLWLLVKNNSGGRKLEC